MTIQWGGWSGHLRVGIEVVTTGYDTYTPSIDVHVRTFVQCDGSWNFADNQTLTLSGSIGATYNFYNGLQANQVLQTGTAVIYGQSQSYGGGPGYYFEARLSGAYNGAAPAVGVNFSLPPRPTRAPSAPGVPYFSQVGPTSAFADFSGSADNGGSSIDQYRIHVATDSGFSNVIRDQVAPSSITGLAPGTRYWVRAFAHNANGYSGASGASSFLTSSYATSAPTISAIGPDVATVNWVAPSGATPTGYEIQWAKDAAFTSGLQTYTSDTWGTSRGLTGLAPATKYWTRVRSKTSTGYGDWSAATSFDTLSGAKIRRNGAWVDAPVYARVGGQWVVAKVWKRVNGAWKL